MICEGCGRGIHVGCRGSTSCACQHRVGTTNVDASKLPKKTDDDEETKE
jgi:hypothetical protein